MIETKVVVIGAGPAGLTAAMQLCRYRIPFVLLEKERVGGLLWEANLVENYAGFPAGVSGAKLARLMAAQAERMGVQVAREQVLRVAILERDKNDIGQLDSEVSRLRVGRGLIIPAKYPKGAEDQASAESRQQELSDSALEVSALDSEISRFRKKTRQLKWSNSALEAADRFHVLTDQNEYCTAYVIVATGTLPRPIPIPIPVECAGRVYSGVSPLLEVSSKQVLIVGAGDAAFDYALRLTKNRNSVTILNRGREVKCLHLLWERASLHPTITYRAEWPVGGVEAGETAGRLRVLGEAGQALEADFLLFAIGRVPQVDFLSTEWLARPPAGLFFAGDVQNGLYRQAAIAAGEGLRAAMHIHFDMEAGAV